MSVLCNSYKNSRYIKDVVLEAAALPQGSFFACLGLSSASALGNLLPRHSATRCLDTRQPAASALGNPLPRHSATRCLGTRQPAASVLNQVPWPRLRLIIFGSGLVSKFPPRSCLNRHGSGRLDLHVPVDYDTIRYKTRQHRMF